MHRTDYIRAIKFLLSGVFCLAMFGVPRSNAQTRFYDGAPLFYSDSKPNDPIAQLRGRLESGELKLNQKNEKDFLRAFLAELEIPIESQVFVFSKTSKQNSLITPQTPRAIYFSDEFYVGWVPGGILEIGSIDKKLGAVFYLLDHRERHKPNGIVFDRPQDCLNCHAGSRTGDFPGFTVRSVYPSENGLPILSEGSFTTTQGSPLEERWGGWYVTGQHGEQRHMGNIIAEVVDGKVVMDLEAGANLDSLAGLFDTSPYLATTSDILALMVLEHQVEMHNRFHRAGFAVRRALHLQHSVDEALGREPSRKLNGTARSVAESHVEKILEQLLFANEVELEDGGIEDGGSFREAFQENALTNEDGRSLRDFQLLDRVFKYRCSYMIYSTSFDNLPGGVKQIFYRRLWDILNGRDTSGDYDHLSTSERERILSILRETKKGLPAYWLKTEKG